MRRRRATGALLMAALVLTACSGPDDPTPDGPPSEGPVVAALPVAWTADWASQLTLDQVFEVGDGIVAVTDDRVLGVDPATGEPTWELAAPGICAQSDLQPGGTRLAVAFTNQANAGRDEETPCRTLGVIDLSTGRWSWRHRLPEPIDTLSRSRALAVGDATVTVLTECCYSKVLRYDLAGGEQLPTFETDLTGWGGSAAIDGQSIAVSSGLGPDSRVRLALYDADTGQRRWQRTVTELVDRNVAAAVVSSDPLVLRTSERGHALLWSLDEATGAPLTPIGPQFPDSTLVMATDYGVHDGAAVVAYGQQSPFGSGVAGLAAYDLDTGLERWSDFPAGGGFVGFDEDDDLVVVNGAGLFAGQAVVTRHPMGDVADFEVLGALEASGFSQARLAGELLVVGQDDAVVAYRLPASGEGQQLDLALPTASAQDALLDPAVEPVDESRWSADDVRPGAISTCHPSTSTLRAAGFHRLDLPEMYGCEWFERQEPLGLTRQLEARYEVVPPTASATASEQAAAKVAELVAGPPYAEGPVEPGPYVPVDGVGDEAWVSQVVGPASYGEVHLVVRTQNVVVTAAVLGQAGSAQAAGVSVAGYVLEDAALAAVSDILRQAGLDLEVPEPAAAGPVTDVGAPCAALDETARSFVTGGRRLDLRPGADPAQRVGGCYWGSGDTAYVRDNGRRIYADYARVLAYVVPGSRLGGATGIAQARSAMATLRKDRGFFYGRSKPVRGLGDEALAFAADEATDESAVVVRLGNLLVEVDVNDQADPVLVDRDRDVLALAREAVAAYR